MQITNELIFKAKNAIKENFTFTTEEKDVALRDLSILSLNLLAEGPVKGLSKAAKSRAAKETASFAVGAVVSYTALIALLIAAGERWFKYYSRKCWDVKGSSARRECKLNAKIAAHKAEIAEAHKLSSSMCGKTTDPERCKMRMKKAVSKFEREIDRLEYLKSKGKMDIASTMTVHGAHPSYRFPIASRSYNQGD